MKGGDGASSVEVHENYTLRSLSRDILGGVPVWRLRIQYCTLS